MDKEILEPNVEVTPDENQVENEVIQNEEENPQMYTKAEMQKYHSDKMNTFLKKLNVTSIDQINENINKLNEEISNIKLENEGLNNRNNELLANVKSMEEKEFLKELGVDESVKEDFNILLKNRLEKEPGLDKNLVGKEILEKYFSNKLITKIGIEKKENVIESTPEKIDEEVFKRNGLF